MAGGESQPMKGVSWCMDKTQNGWFLGHPLLSQVKIVYTLFSQDKTEIVGLVRGNS